MKEPTPRPGDRGDGRCQDDDELQMDTSILPNPVALVTNWLDQHQSAFEDAMDTGDINAAFLIVSADRVFTPALQALDREAVR